jgi:hypothetical protein
MDVVPQAGDGGQGNDGLVAVAPHGRLLAAGRGQVSEAVEAGQPVAFAAGPAALARLVSRWEGVQGGITAQPGGQADPIRQPQPMRRPAGAEGS